MRQFAFVVVVGLTGSALAQRAEYQGPTILSRGVGTVLRGGGELVRLRPYATVTGIYDSGLTAVSVDPEGNILQQDDYGVSAQFGASGYHTWRRTVLGMNYAGDFRHYTRRSYYDGTDQRLSLGITHQVSRRVAFSFRESAGTYSRSFGAPSARGFFDPEFAGTPNDELFDGRTYYASTMGDLTVGKGPRLSFNIGGSGLIVRRRSRALIGVTGATARGDIAYRLNRSNTIGIDYGFTHFSFTNSFGSSDVQRLSMNYAARLGRRWDFALRAGVSRVETLGLRRVAIDPIVAAIIGQTVGVETFHRLNYIPRGDVRLSRSFQRSTISFAYSRAVSPGNGIYLTSQRESADASFSHSTARRWNFAVTAVYNSFSSLGQVIGKYQSYGGGVGVTYRLSQWLYLVSRFDTRKFSVGGNPFQRVHYRGSLGFGFSPGDLPLSLW